MTGSRTKSAATQGDAWMPWAIIGLAGLFEAVTGALWVALGASAAAAGHGWDAPAFQAGIGPIRAVTGPERTGSTPVLVGVLVAELAVVAAIAWTVTVRVRRSLARRRKLASALAVNARIDVEGTTSKDRAAETARLHPTLTGTAAATVTSDGKTVAIRDVLGYVLPAGPAVLPGFEDVELAFMAPRSGKTTARAIPKLLGAPGPAVGTANKSDLWQATTKIRGERGQVWTFDPQAITHTPQRFWWNPLARVVDDESADRLAAQFIKVTAANGGSDTFWSESAQELLTALLLAASVGQHAGGGARSLRDVWRWLNRPTDEEPVRILINAGWEQLAYGLRGAQNGAVDTREGIFQTARTGARCLRSETILRWVTPPSTPVGSVPVGELRLDRFVDSAADTVYLLSKDGAGSAAPLLAGFLDQLFECCQLSAERNGGRLAVPMTAVIDEAANIAPWDRLPAVASYAGSLGFVFLAILQNYAQGKRVWGEAGMEELFSACTLKLIGAGIDDADFARDISTLVGRHEVDRRSTSYSRGGRSDSWSSEMRDMLPPDELRAMPKGTGLVLFTGRRPMMLQLQPWYTATYQDAVRASITEGKAAVVNGANSPVGGNGRGAVT